MTKRPRPVDALPISLAPRGLSRSLAAGYIGVSVSLFDQMVADKRMPQPKQINSRKIWDRFEIDKYFDDLEEGDNSQWDDVRASTVFDQSSPDVAKSHKERPDIPQTPEEWQERQRQWRIEVAASSLQSRELVGLAGLYEVKSERIKRIKGASINTMERLHARGYVEPDGESRPGRCTSYKITDAGERAWERLPEATRKAVTFTMAPPFPV